MTPSDAMPLPPAGDDSLAALGISAFEEALYRALLRAPGSTTLALADTLGTSVHAVELAAAALESKGFATYAPETVPRLFPSPPDIAVESLLLHRHKELLRARRAVANLQREQPGHAGDSPVVEIIDADPAAQEQPYALSHSRARTEVLCLVRPPFRVSSPNKAEDTRAEARRRGVRYRNIVHPDTLALPGWPEILRKDIEAGEEVRLLADFPFKMIVADRELGLMPLRIDQPQGAMLLLRRSAVLDALCELFETLWVQAVPIRFGSAGQVIVGAEATHTPQLQAMVALLAAGVNDKSIADQLGMSERTLMRRVDLLYQTLNARSRFQAGWLAALQAVNAGASGVDRGSPPTRPRIPFSGH